MNEVIGRGATRIALRVSRDRNRRLLADLLADHDVVDITDTVPGGTDLCIVDDRGLTRIATALTDWKHDQQPTYAPVLLLSESSRTNPWKRYGGRLGEQIDAIQPIPAPKMAIRTRVESLLETRRYSEELASERQLVEQIFDTSPIAKVVLDADGNIVRANQRAEDVLGLRRSELSERSYDSPEWRIIDENGDPIPSDDLPFSRVMRSGEPVYGYEHGIERLDGDRAWLSINMGPILDENGEIDYLVSSIEDVTERKRLERELRESDELHRATLSNIMDTVFITDDAGRFTYICPNVHFIFGYTADEVREMGTVEALLGEDPAPDGVADGETAENIDWQVTDSEGEEHILLVTVTSVSIQDGSRLYSARDVTDLVESERRLELERERLETVVSNAPLILSAVDSDGTITLSKGKQLEQIGLEPGELVGKSVEDAFGDVPEILDNVERALDGEEFWTETRIGDRYLQAWHQPVFEDGDVAHVIVVAQDITDRKRQEERFQAFVEGSSDIITVLGSGGVVEYVSPSVERILGYDPDELVGENAFDIIHPEDRDDLVAGFAELSREDGETFTKRYRTRHADGSWRWTESRTTKRPDMAQGRYVVNTRDVTEQVDVERKLRRTEQSRSLALKVSQAGVWEWNLETDEVIWNEAMEALFGINPDTFEGTYEAFADRLHPEDLPDVEAAIEQSIEQDEPFHTSFRIVRDDGVERWVEARGKVVSDGAGAPERMLGVNVDITERKERERELEQYETIVETAADPIYVLDDDGQVTLVNEAFTAAVGLAKSEITGEKVTTLLDRDDVEASLVRVEELSEGAGSHETLEVSVSTPEGQRQYEVNITPITGAEDGVSGTVGVAREVTDLREHERQLRRTQRAIEASGHAIYITDPDGVIEYVNPAFEEITGYAREEVIGNTPQLLSSGELPETHYAELWATIKSGDIWDEEIVNERKDGGQYHAAQTIAPIMDENSRIEGFVAIQTDITDHKDRLQQLRVMDRVLRHNLHNDMNVIRGFAEIVRQEAEDPVSNYGKQIVEHSDHLLNLTDKQRKITEVLSSEPHRESVDAVSTVQRTVEMISKNYPDARIDLDLPEEATVSATDGLGQAIEELVSNAITHTDREVPDVAIQVTNDVETVQIRIADTGPGIPEMDRRVVLGKHEVEQLYHGTGLGLWLVSWIIRRSNGSLWFEENEPRGSVVVITLRKPTDATNGLS
ncbi:PAS domain S-box protein [Haloplanus aerogenes]|uniref:histidine kinase n=1 Tax=Haloplanus aerogenes TaxID=660522 RepID=A0A3M0DRL7_9EURY|nr:PAS domain S-box protein [Haloplanus aerogenes]AZH26460.1 PAS domain S-box protein [Haloplanus aerogenes]RMB18073.1 PAS domain S-box-containing protein [Haloplanus aerogenes]